MKNGKWVTCALCCPLQVNITPALKTKPSHLGGLALTSPPLPTPGGCLWESTQCLSLFTKYTGVSSLPSLPLQPQHLLRCLPPSSSIYMDDPTNIRASKFPDFCSYNLLLLYTSSTSHSLKYVLELYHHSQLFHIQSEQFRHLL